MADGIKNLVIGFLLLGLFAISLIYTGINIANSNNASQSIGDQPELAAYKTAVTSTLEEAHANANATESAIGKSPVTLTSGTGIIFDAVGGVWKTIFIVPYSIYNLTVNVLLTNVFGSEEYAIVFSVLSAILILLVVFAVWRWVSTGSEE